MDTPHPSRGRLRLKALAFVVLAFVLTFAVDWSFLRAIGGQMWAPGIAAVLVQLGFERRLSGLGWRPPNWRWLLLSVGFPLAYVVLAYAAAWGTGAASLVPAPLDWIREVVQVHVGLPPMPDWALVPVFAGLVLTMALAMGTISAFGEELGWRGLLFPALKRADGFWPAALASGVIWAAWHWHGILYGGYHAGGDPLASVALFSVMIVLMSIGMGWLTLRTGSVWPATLVHAGHNAFIQAAFEPLTARPEGGQWITGEWGVAIPLAITVVLVAATAWRRRRAGSG